MATKLTAEDASQSLSAHVAAKGSDVHEKYGPHIGWNELLRILEDRACCRYPCKVSFDAGPLQPGEAAYPVALGQAPEEGFAMHVHPHFMRCLDQVPYLVLYQLVVVNYGEFASPEDAEVFGSSALGLPRDDYYQALCAMVDEIDSGDETSCECQRGNSFCSEK
jgi:hypothetical protein